VLSGRFAEGDEVVIEPDGEGFRFEAAVAAARPA
jgi:hypothetical protein